MSSFKVGILQFAPVFGNRKKNIEKIFRFLKKFNGDLVVLPELCTSGYLFTNKRELRELSEEIPGSSIFSQFKDFSREKNCVCIVGFPEKDKKGNFYNSAFYVTPSGEFGIYRKVHLFFEEKKFFKPGNSLNSIFEWKGIKIGIIICFDWYFPESARTYALQGIHILAHPSNLILPWGQKAMVIRALENKVFTITANRVGIEKKGKKVLEFTGRSQIVSPDGKILLQFTGEEEGVKVIEINPLEAENKNITPLNNFLKDRRKECYRI